MAASHRRAEKLKSNSLVNNLAAGVVGEKMHSCRQAMTGLALGNKCNAYPQPCPLMPWTTYSPG
jgi:hypothetical protein